MKRIARRVSVLLVSLLPVHTQGRSHLAELFGTGPSREPVCTLMRLT